MLPRVVLDTNVLVAGLRSRRGASFRVLSLMGTGRFEAVISVPLVLEYEEILGREASALGLTPRDVTTVVDYLCSACLHQNVFFLWRPMLRDPDDDMIVELAVAGGCEFIITHNVADYALMSGFDLEALTPGQFLHRLGELS